MAKLPSGPEGASDIHLPEIEVSARKGSASNHTNNDDGNGPAQSNMGSTRARVGGAIKVVQGAAEGALGRTLFTYGVASLAAGPEAWVGSAALIGAGIFFMWRAADNVGTGASSVADGQSRDSLSAQAAGQAFGPGAEKGVGELGEFGDFAAGEMHVPEAGPGGTEEPPSTGGGSATAGEPVVLATGEYQETWHDFLVPGELRFDGARFMGTLLKLPEAYESPFGRCQISAFDEIFINAAPGLIDFVRADGERIRFDRPFNFLASRNGRCPQLDLRAPWLRQLELRDQSFIKYFRQYDDDIYRLEKLEDRNGNSIVFTRDNKGRLQRTDGPNGLSLHFSNNESGLRNRVILIGTEQSQVELARYSYDARGRMTAAECAFGMSVRYYWHPERDLLLRWHNTTMRSETFFTHDAEGRVLHTRTNGIWNNDRFRYDPTNRGTTYLPSGDERLAQCFRYDANNNVTQETDALGHTLYRVFDAAGFETSATDANGNSATKAYDSYGNIRRLTDPEGRSTTYAWGPHGELDMVIDGAGYIRRWERDRQGNLLAATCAEGHTTRFVRNEQGQLLRTVYPDGAEESRAYDAYGRLTAVTDARGGRTQLAYDVFGRIFAHTDALGHVTCFEYGAAAGGFATPIAMVRPDGVRIERAYTAEGVLASLTDGEGRRWTYTYGAFDILESIEDPSGGCFHLKYDCEGRLTVITNQVGATYCLVRDAAGRVVAEEDFDSRRTNYSRDAGGRLVETRKPDGVKLVYGYDKSDNVISIMSFAPGSGPSASPLDATYFWYDRRGLLVKASNQAALVEFERDGNGRIVRETTNGRSIKNELDENGLRVGRRIGCGHAAESSVKIVRDQAGTVASITVDDHATITFERDVLGRETRRFSANGFNLDQSWDAVGQLTRQRFGVGVCERRYTWDRARAPVKIEDAREGVTTFSYDANGQIATAQFGDRLCEKFVYDSAWNIAHSSHGSYGAEAGFLGEQSTTGGVAQMVFGPNGERVFLAHDACGRVVERRVERKGFRPKVWRYSWDAHDRLENCVNDEGETWFYRYDPLGRRVTKVRKLSEQELAWTAQRHSALVPAAAREATKIWTWPQPPKGTALSDTGAPAVGTFFLWDGDVIAQEVPLHLDGEINWAASTQWHYEPETFRPFAKQSPNGSMVQIVNDHLGTPRAICDTTGRLVGSNQYSTWGAILELAPADSEQTNGDLPDRGTLEEEFRCHIRYQGQWEDRENGLYYNHHRYYDPLTRQYASPDPVGIEGGLRPQSYVARPGQQTDPLGLLPQVRQNQIAGAGREQTAGDMLQQQNPDATLATQRYLKDQSGKSVKDPVTGERRRIDIAVIKEDKAKTYEVTSMNAKKKQQLDKEQRIIDNGGTFIKDPSTGKTVPVEGPSELMRLK